MSIGNIVEAIGDPSGPHAVKASGVIARELERSADEDSVEDGDVEEYEDELPSLPWPAAHAALSLAVSLLRYEVCSCLLRGSDSSSNC